MKEWTRSEAVVMLRKGQGRCWRPIDICVAFSSELLRCDGEKENSRGAGETYDRSKDGQRQ
jgi:hypothetical protein